MQIRERLKKLFPELRIQLETVDFSLPLTPEQEASLIEISALPDQAFIEKLQPLLSMLMARLREAEGEKIRGDKWVYHMLPSPRPGLENPLVVLPGRGCGYEKGSGGCSMCNFAGEGRPATIQDVDEAMDFIIQHNAKTFERIPGHPLAVVNINALGSFFHAGELSSEVRRHIYTRIRAYQETLPDKKVLFVLEARIDHLDEAVLKEMRECLGPKVLVDLGVGIESTQLLVREGIINKGLPADWLARLALLKKYHVDLTSHFMFGTPLLDAREQVQDSVRSISEFSRLTSEVVNNSQYLFMVMNCKPGTLPEFLRRNGEYQLPNILSVAQGILDLQEELPPQEFEKIMIFGLVGPELHMEGGVEYVRPHDPNCPCTEIHRLLAEWRSYPSYVKKLKELMGNLPEDCETRQQYAAQKHDTAIQEAREPRALRRKIAETYLRMGTAILPGQVGKDLTQLITSVK